MSRLFEKLVDYVFRENPQAYEEHQQRKLDAECKEFHHIRDEWISGKRTPLTHSIAEWIWAGKPTPIKSDILTAK